MIRRDIRDRFKPPAPKPPKDLPPDTPERRKWVKGLKAGDLVALVRDGQEGRSIRVLALYGNRRAIGSRALEASGSLRPRAKGYRYDRPDQTAEWLLPPSAEEVARHHRGVVLAKLRQALGVECRIKVETLEAMLALAEKDGAP